MSSLSTIFITFNPQSSISFLLPQKGSSYLHSLIIEPQLFIKIHCLELPFNLDLQSLTLFSTFLIVIIVVQSSFYILIFNHLFSLQIVFDILKTFGRDVPWTAFFSLPFFFPFAAAALKSLTARLPPPSSPSRLRNKEFSHTFSSFFIFLSAA